jgi:hypothetical protein
MRILGDVSQFPPPLESSVAMRPCSRCGVPIPESAAVCSHCHCYVGVLPAFMQQMTESSQTHQN